MDRLSTGHLAAWGRPREDEDAPFVEIEQRYWKTSEWSYYFLGDEDLAAKEHARKLFDMSTYENYFDVHFNRVQVERMWPSKQ